MPEPDWSRWIGIPYEEPFGCFTFVRRFFEEELGLPVRDFGAAVADTALAKDIAFRDALAGWCKPVETPSQCDVVLFGRSGMLDHIGIVVDPRRRDMLHCNKRSERHIDARSTIERYGGLIWRPVGFWRYAPLG